MSDLLTLQPSGLHQMRDPGATKNKGKLMSALQIISDEYSTNTHFSFDPEQTFITRCNNGNNADFSALPLKHSFCGNGREPNLL